MSIVKRIKEKILLWVRFYSICNNFYSVLFQRILAMLGLSHLFKINPVIELKNGTKIAQNRKVDVSAVPVVVEVWGTESYTVDGLPIEAHDTVIDIGANVGNFAMYAATKTDGRIVCFEPLPSNMELIKRSIELNKFNNITPVEAAVAHNEDNIKLQLSHSNAMHRTAPSTTEMKDSITVSAVNLEKYCAEHGISNIEYLKMDCEGGEYDIILNWSDNFAQNVKKIVAEYHDHPNYTYKDLIAKLSTQGFAVNEDGGHYIFATRS